MDEADLNKTQEELSIQAQLKQLERENRKLRREVGHLQNAIKQERLASTTLLNQQKASTFIQRERERYLALLLANSPSIILLLNQSRRVEFSTDYFIKKAHRAHVTDIQGHTLPDVLAPFMDADSLNDLLTYKQNAIEQNEPVSFDATFCFDEEGGAEDFAGLIVPMTDESGHSSGLMLMFHDVTDLKRSREEALAASRAKSDFLSNMSHEIRTPMNAIIGMTSIGKQEQTLERKDYALTKIENASTLLLGIINDILDISKIESGKMELSEIVFDFKQMLDRVMGVISLKMQDKHQHFAAEIDPAIPTTLFGDDQRLSQVITNILSNATKFTPEQGLITFKANLLHADRESCRIQMLVKDSGIGMSKDEQAKLFNIFQQAEAGTSRKYGGSGLGLAISKRILELMGGEIWVESTPGSGSCFFFTVNLQIPQETAVTADSRQITDASSAAEDKADSDFTGKVILIADDIDINLEIIMTLLEPTGATMITARNGREAVNAFAADPQKYDLILMDVQMPEVDGLQATRMIRALPVPQAATVPIIAMTANVFKEDIEKCMESGMNDHLGKPIVMTDVIRMLSHYIN